MESRTDPPGQRALRRGRVSLTHNIYLITTVTRGREPVFGHWRSAAAAARVTGDAEVMGGNRFLAWVLMPDHFHGLLQLAEGAALSAAVQAYKGNVARRVNALGARRGPLWQPGFHDHALRKDEDLQTAARYVVANPLRAGLVARLGDYPYWNAEWL